MSSRSDLLDRQQSWAKRRGIETDPRGYVETVEVNLWRPLSGKARVAFEQGSGSELMGKMRALHSSSALAVNFFDYWTTMDRADLRRVLGLESAVKDIQFEAQHATGLEGSPPNLDVCIALESEHVVAIESKFSEWLSRKSAAKPAFKPKYFDGGSQFWADRGLPKCQALANEMREGKKHFEFFDASQILKHALGLATQLRDRFSLWYVYYDFQCAEAAQHRAEIDDFAHRVGAELRFKVMTYQEVFASLSTASRDLDPSYLGYLSERYFTLPR